MCAECPRQVFRLISLVSLATVIDNIQNHPNPPISLHKQQVEALVQKITFLQGFLEVHSHSDATNSLESLIREAAYAAEDAIETYIVDQIGRSASCADAGGDHCAYLDLQKVIEDIGFIEKLTIDLKDQIADDDDHQHASSMSDASLVSPSLGQETVTVGFEDELTEILDMLTGEHSSRQIIPITGMGGIGKTTLALEAYEHALTKYHFDFRTWITISQKYEARDILLQILGVKHGETSSHMNEEQLGERIYKSLCGHRYLIVLDDMWTIGAWNDVKHFFPDNNNGSRMIITTRLYDVASQLSSFRVFPLNLLNVVKSWNLLCKTVFGEDTCPRELEEIGKTIAKNCRGLPLSIVVIGRLLAKSEQRKENWEYIARNTSSIVNLEEDERCLKILDISYRHLPVHLKPCFLYLGVYMEDANIHLSRLVKLLVSEGFLKPIDDKIIEDVAEECIKELANRNLILINELGATGGIKSCKVHDMVRDLCIREAQKEKFFYIIGEQNLEPQEGISTNRRFIVHRRTREYPPQVIAALQTAPHARSISMRDLGSGRSQYIGSRLLRILKTTNERLDFDYEVNNTSDQDHTFWLYNLRYLAISSYDKFILGFGSSFSLLWNLQTLIVTKNDTYKTAPVEIWKMPQLRHIKFSRLNLPSPPKDSLILQNLQTLSFIIRFTCSEEVVTRIPNIRKLRIEYPSGEDYTSYYLNHIQHLHKLEHLHCFFETHGLSQACASNFQQTLTFPHSLQKLTIGGVHVCWEHVTAMIGSLPHLQKLTLLYITGSEWRPIEGQFLSLKLLQLAKCNDLEYWTTNSSHFPVLQRLVMFSLPNLAKIPSDIAEIPTLKSISLMNCKDSAIFSAKKIAEEQEELGNCDLVFSVLLYPTNNVSSNLRSNNFKIGKYSI